VGRGRIRQLAREERLEVISNTGLSLVGVAAQETRLLEGGEKSRGTPRRAPTSRTLPFGLVYYHLIIGWNGDAGDYTNRNTEAAAGNGDHQQGSVILIARRNVLAV